MKVLDLFSGVGGFSLGLERAGMQTVAFCEIDPFCHRVLRKHWPKVPIYEDIRELTAAVLDRDGIVADVICGGFPCQDVSTAGQRAGLAGARSGLWRDFARVIREVRPAIAIVENTPGLLSLGMGEVLGDLAAIGYDAEWECIPAGALGAHHERDRVWIFAYPNGQGEPFGTVNEQMACLSGSESDVMCEGRSDIKRRRNTEWPSRLSTALATAYGAGGCREWAPEPNVVRVVDGISNRAYGPRIRALGNAVVPQVAELIGRAIIDSH